MNLSKVLESINYTKEDVLDPNGKDYVPFVVNKSLSYFMDTVAYANEMNKYPFRDKRMQYDYLKGSIRKRKRFSGWVKKDKSDVIFKGKGNSYSYWSFFQARKEAISVVPYSAQKRQICYYAFQGDVCS